MTIVVREARFDEAQLIADLTRASWAKTVALSSSGHRETAHRVEGDLRHGGAFLLLIDSEVVGSVRWIPHETEPDIWDIRRMGILPDWRGQQLSQHLIEAVIHLALETKASELRLAVRTTQTALVDLYTTLGFEVAPELEYDHANPLEPAPYVMRRFL
jgi:ribosomal protein S18 acetylase RimI-like enzyme